MKNLIHTLPILVLMFIATSMNAQVLEPVKWVNSVKQIDNSNFEISFKASIDKGWHLYGLNIPEGGPVATSFTFEENSSIELLGKPVSSIKPKKVFDNTFEMDLELFDGSVTFRQKVKLKDKNAKIKGSIEFMSCDDSRCLPPVTKDFEFEVQTASKSISESAPKNNTDEITAPIVSIDTQNAISGADDKLAETETQPVASSEVSSSTDNTEPKKSLWQIFLKALATGFIAVFTPCVLPIIPLTIAFFMRDNTARKRISQALMFGLTIVVIYTFVGFLAGLTGINLVDGTKHWAVNLIIFIILLIFAASFFGMFELVLPGNLSNKLDKEVDKGGFLAPVFLAIVTTIVSFSCVSLFAGSALGTALTGEIIMPTIAMFGFSISFAFPFVLIGIFPELIKKLPKSGGWLNSIKVFFAFITLAASLIFLGNTQWKIFNRDVIISLNIVIFLLLGFYLLGKLKFAHDSELPYIKVPRLLLAIASLSVSVYLIPGLFGSQLKAVSAFLPAPETSEFSILRQASSFTSNQVKSSNTELCDTAPKYSDILTMPQNLNGYFDYEEGMACAKKLNKPVLLDFAGHTCKNCKKMYAEVWSDSRVWEKLNSEFIIIALYTDETKELPQDEWVTSTIDNKIKKTIGAKNLDFELTRFVNNSLPLYVILDTDGNIITKEKYYTYSSNIENFLAFLNEGISNFEQKK